MCSNLFGNKDYIIKIKIKIKIKIIIIIIIILHELWFKFIFDANFLKPVHFLFSFVLHDNYHNMEHCQIKLNPVQKMLHK